MKIELIYWKTRLFINVTITLLLVGLSNMKLVTSAGWIWRTGSNNVRKTMLIRTNRNFGKKPLVERSSRLNEKEYYMGPFFDKVKERLEEIKYVEKTEGKAAVNSLLDPRKIFSGILNVSESENTVTKEDENETFPVIYENKHPPDVFMDYEEVVNEIIARFSGDGRNKIEDIDKIKSWLLNPNRLIPVNLPMLYQDNQDDKIKFKNDFITELKSQRDVFLNESSLNEKQYSLAQKVLTYLGDTCAKRMLTSPLVIGWDKIKEAGMLPRKQSMNTYLYVLGNLFSATRQTWQENDYTKNIDIIPSQVALFHDYIYDPCENSISLRVKGLVAKKEALKAEALLESWAEKNSKKDSQMLRLRTYLPIFKAYCDAKDCASALKLFSKMRTSSGVKVEPENYISLLAILAENGSFANDAEPIKEASALGYTQGYGTVFFDELLKEMSNDVLEINSASARLLFNSFSSSNESLEKLPALADLPLNETVCGDEELVVSRVHINNTTAICSRTKSKLRLLKLGSQEKKLFYNKLLQMSSTSFDSFTASLDMKVSSKNGNRAFEELSKFANWLDTRKGEPFTAIVDGANVAYFAQNFDQGKFNYYQIKFLFDTLTEKHEVPLVILPFKYTLPTFYANTGQKLEKQKLTKKEFQILKTFNETNQLYRVPSQCLDDFYWMLASVSNQTNVRGDTNLDVHPDNEHGRFPGTRPMLLTNDKMRDHRLEVLEPRLFRRWTSSHIVNYDFSVFYNDDNPKSSILFSAPDFFSREIQGNPTFTSQGLFAGTVWHLPVKDWDVNERLCIRISTLPK